MILQRTVIENKEIVHIKNIKKKEMSTWISPSFTYKVTSKNLTLLWFVLFSENASKKRHNCQAYIFVFLAIT